MKQTVQRWTKIQNALFEMGGQRWLWEKIEVKTWGKRWTQTVAIYLTKDEQAAVEAALEALRGEEGARPGGAGEGGGEIAASG